MFEIYNVYTVFLEPYLKITALYWCVLSKKCESTLSHHVRLIVV